MGEMWSFVSAMIALLALGVSIATAWLTFFRRGTVRMTQPTVIFFGPDGSRSKTEKPSPKIYLRTLLFATSRRGRIVESMHVALSRGETRQNFNIWVYGEGALVRGSGLFVGETGVTANHHFLTPKDGSVFSFLPGRYRLDVHARILGDRRGKILFSQDLEVLNEESAALERSSVGLYFDWGADAQQYVSHLDASPVKPSPEDILSILSLSKTELIAADKPADI